MGVNIKSDEKILAEQLSDTDLERAYLCLNELLMISQEFESYFNLTCRREFWYEMKKRGLFDRKRRIDQDGNR